MNLPSRRRVAAVTASSLRAIVDRWCSTLASYISGEKIRRDLPFTRYALHNMVVCSKRYLINRVE